MEKVSIIVPIYDAEASLGYCLNSIISQTYTNLEIILVNDGSKDSSLQICRNYADIDDRIRIIDQENGGVSRARNTGLHCATGTYVQFADADDRLALDMVERLVEAMECYDTDLVICGFKMVKLKDQLPVNVTHCTSMGLGQTCVLSQKLFFEHFAEILLKTATLESSWNKLYKHSILKDHDLRFPEEVSLGEDFMLNMSFFEHMGKGAVLLANEYYYYMQTNPSSLVNRYRPDLFENELMLIEAARKLLNRNVRMSVEEQNFLREYTLAKAIFCIKETVNAADMLTEAQIKRQLAKIINNDTVRDAVEHSCDDSPYVWFRDVCRSSSIDELYARTMQILKDEASTRVATEFSSARNPGIVNHLIVKALNIMLKIHDDSNIAALRDNIYDFGIKAALRDKWKIK